MRSQHDAMPSPLPPRPCCWSTVLTAPATATRRVCTHETEVQTLLARLARCLAVEACGCGGVGGSRGRAVGGSAVAVFAVAVVLAVAVAAAFVLRVRERCGEGPWVI